MSQFDSLTSTIGIDITDEVLLQNVFIHRSFLNENKNYNLPSNEKLEFLGDSVLSLVTSIYLYKNYPELVEGQYTDIKASVVRMESLSAVAVRLGLGAYLQLSKGEEQNNGRVNTNILADCFEALIAAVFLDKGFEVSYEFISRFLFADRLDHIVKNKLYLSPKSHLQEIVQDRFKVLPTYTIVTESGPEHDKMFRISVSIQDTEYGVGEAKSKKHAEENAARIALEKLLDK